MIGFSRPEDFSQEIRALSPDFADWAFLKKSLSALPEKFAGPVTARYREIRGEKGQQAANLFLLGKQSISASSISLAASDGEVCQYASERAAEVRNILASVTGVTTPELMRGRLLRYAQRHGALLPVKVTLPGIIARLTDGAFWRRQIRRGIARDVEACAIDLGLVHRRAGLYASDESCSRHAEQKRRNLKALEATEATNQDGYSATLAELSAVGVSNPKIRRMELMTRIAGFEGFAKQAGHVGMFYTVTTPSRMHPRLSVSGQANPKYDGTTPKEAAQYLSKKWSRARAWLHRRGISIYGFRVAEPHHDGTPHWHMLFFMLSDAVESVTYCLRRYFSEEDAHELTTEAAQRARFESVRIDWKRGSAAGYISKYIAKNIDGQRNDASAAGDDFEAAEPTSATETAPRVLAWASTWGIRQFQQIGGPGVTVWRELRRIREMRQGDLFDAWSAADAGDWQAFTERQGGVDIRRADRPVQLWAEQVPGKKNRYGEDAGKEIHGVEKAGVLYETRRHVWTIRKVQKGEKAAPVGRVLARPEAAQPWSPVNNCTEWASAIDADGYAIGEFSEKQPAGPLPGWAVEEVKAALRDAVLLQMAQRRKRGAFGQFPKLKG